MAGDVTDQALLTDAAMDSTAAHGASLAGVISTGAIFKVSAMRHRLAIARHRRTPWSRSPTPRARWRRRKGLRLLGHQRHSPSRSNRWSPRHILVAFLDACTPQPEPHIAVFLLMRGGDCGPSHVMIGARARVPLAHAIVRTCACYGSPGRGCASRHIALLVHRTGPGFAPRLGGTTRTATAALGSACR